MAQQPFITSFAAVFVVKMFDDMNFMPVDVCILEMFVQIIILTSKYWNCLIIIVATVIILILNCKLFMEADLSNL